MKFQMGKQSTTIYYHIATTSKEHNFLLDLVIHSMAGKGVVGESPGNCDFYT